MGAVKSLAVFGAGVVVGAAAVTAHRMCEETDRPLCEVMSEVPGELQRLCSEARVKAVGMYEKGQTAVHERWGQDETDDSEESVQE